MPLFVTFVLHVCMHNIFMVWAHIGQEDAITGVYLCRATFLVGILVTAWAPKLAIEERTLCW